MLEQQQEKLVNATRELYTRAVDGGRWPGQPLQVTPRGYPLTHDILERLGLLRLGPQDDGTFEENTEILRQKMMIIKQEENPYPTPATTQSELSPVESPNYELTSRSFVDGIPRTSFQPTPPISPEEQESMIFPVNGIGIDTSMCMESTSIQACQAWIPSASRYVRSSFPSMYVAVYVRGAISRAKHGDLTPVYSKNRSYNPFTDSGADSELSVGMEMIQTILATIVRLSTPTWRCYTKDRIHAYRYHPVSRTIMR